MKIEIDTQACGNPLDCRLCLDRCPQRVFGTHELRLMEPGVLAGEWVITPVFTSQCTGCMECVEFCPRKAILVRK